MTLRVGVLGALGMLFVVARGEAAEPQPPAESAAEPPAAAPPAPPTPTPPQAPVPVTPTPAPAEDARPPASAASPLRAETPAAPASTELGSMAAPAPDSTLALDDGSLGDNQRHFSAVVGVRSVVVVDSSYEPFAARNVLGLFSVGANAVLAAQGPLSLAVGVGWEIGGSSSDVRTAETDVLVQRFGVTPEARYHLSRRIYLLARVGIGAGYLRATLEDQAAGDDRAAEGVSFTADPGIGVAVQLTSPRSSHRRQPRLWVTAGAGYLYDSGVALSFGGEGADVPARSAAIDLGKLSLSGPYGHLAGVLGF